MSRTCRGAVFSGQGTPLNVQEFPLPELADGEILVKVTCCTICGSDLHTYEGRRSTPTPTILGHEILGTIAMLPANAPLDGFGVPLKVGERVTWSVAASCGACFFCLHDLPQKCEQLFKYGHERISERHPLSGGTAEYCHLAKGTAVFPISSAIPDAVACPANCATATVAAAFRAGKGCEKEVVVIQGLGVLGLTACAMASTNGARAVVATDSLKDRLDLALKFGATHVVPAGTPEELQRVVKSVSDGRGADLVIELCGAAAAAESGMDLLRTGGRYVWVGAVFPSRPVAISPEQVVRRCLTIKGVHNYAPVDLGNAVKFLETAHSRFPFADLVSRSFPLAQAEEAFQFALESRALRVALTMS